MRVSNKTGDGLVILITNVKSNLTNTTPINI